MDTEQVYQAPRSDLQVTSEAPPAGEPPGYVDQAFRLRIVGVQSFKIALWSMGLFYLTAVFFGMFL